MDTIERKRKGVTNASIATDEKQQHDGLDFDDEMIW